MALSAEYDPLIRVLGEKGMVLKHQKGGHYKLVSKGRESKIIRTKSGHPITLPSTPAGGTSRAYANLVGKLKAEGIIDRDPRGRAQKGEISPAFAKARDEHIAQRRKEMHEASDKTRAALEPVWAVLTAHPKWQVRGWRGLVGTAYERWIAHYREGRTAFGKPEGRPERISNSIHEVLNGNNIDILRTEELIEFAVFLNGDPWDRLVALTSLPILGPPPRPTPEPVAETPPEPEPEPEYHRVPPEPVIIGIPREKVDFAMEVLAEILGDGDRRRIERALNMATRVLES